nr:integrase, catalytic region, zinc finger, CCHC-type, peptidase aspartic, catalytic [Tanacetum cinerariifolium]
MKIKALKEQAKVAKPVKTLTVYPPNTPVKLVPRMLPTKSQVKINIFAVIQLFLEFEKTCKKRITPTGLTEGERGFEQTKECYLNEVIPFFKTLKEHFEGIQKALTTEINKMKAVFDELEAKVDQNAMNRRFSEMHDAHTVVQAHCLELESELSKLTDKIQKDDHYVMVKCFSNLEVQYLNLQLKYQHLKENLGNNNSLPAQDGPDFESVFEIKKLKASIQGKDNAIRKLRTQISQLQETRSEADRTLDFRALDFQITQNNREVHLDYLKHLKESVATLREIVEEAKFESLLDRSVASACLYTKHSQEILEYVIGTCPKDFNKQDKKQATTPLNRKSKSLLRTNVVQIVLWYLDSGCSKHITRDCSRLKNFMKMFIETVRFRNDHFGAIMGYGDYVIGDSVISRVYYVEGLGHNLFFVGQFCDSDLEVAFRKHSCYVRDTDGVKLIKDSRGSNLYTISVEDMMKSSPIFLLTKASKTKSWLWRYCLDHLNFDTINDLEKKDLVKGLPRLKFEKDHICFACQLGKSKKHTHLPKAENTNLEVLITLHMDLCRPMRVQTINGKKYILVIVDDYTRFT